MVTYYVSKYCNKKKVDKWDKENIDIKNFFMLCKKHEEDLEYIIEIYVYNGKKMVHLSNQRAKKREVKKLLKDKGFVPYKKYEHFDTTGDKRKNIFKVTDESILIPLSADLEDLRDECLAVKKISRNPPKNKEKKKKKRKKKKQNKYLDSEDENENQNEEEEFIPPIVIKNSISENPKEEKKRSRVEDDEDCIDKEHIKKRVKLLVSKLDISCKKEICDDIFNQSFDDEGEKKIKEVFLGGKEIKDYIKEKGNEI